MMNLGKWTGIVALTALAGAFLGDAAQAQSPTQRRSFGFTPVRNLGFTGGTIGYPGPPINPNWLVSPGINIRQATYNTAMWGRAFSYIPPYLLGYNPYPSIANYGPLYNSGVSPYNSPYLNPYAGAALSTSPYGGAGYGAYGGSALSSAGGLPTGYDGSSNPYGSGYGYGESSIGGFMRGTADVINSQGKLLNQMETSKLLHEQVRQAKIDTRRKLFDEIMYERAHTPTATELREKAKAEELRHDLNVAPVTEMWSAKALNGILDDLKKLHGKNARGPRIEIDPDTLKQINVRGNGPGNIGLLRNEGRLNWPLGLTELKPAEESKDLRSTLDAKAVEAVNQARTGKVNPGVIKDLQANVSSLHRLLAKNVNELPANQYIEAKRFLNQFDDAIKALQDPNVGNYFNKTYVAKGPTVQDLVDDMAKKGLTFAPATPGDEAAYQALHTALAAYDQAARQDLQESKTAAKE
jgi:hypothetical protein